MKIQCACGAKFEFDVQPEMLTQPVRFVCPQCGVDSSAYVNELVRQELGQAPPAAPALLVRVPGGIQDSNVTSPAAAEQQFCLRHPGFVTVENCLVCQKPICPKCMELFGYVCSPLCKQKAEFQRLEIPEYAGQRFVVERNLWRQVNLVAGILATIVVLLLAAWVWYVGFGARPKPVFSVRFEDSAYSGQSRLCGQNQIVFLHGCTLARHDLKTKKPVWSRELVDKFSFARAAAEATKALQQRQQRAELEGADPDSFFYRVPSLETMTKRIARTTAGELEFHVRGQNVWVSSPGRLVRYDWDTGEPVQEIALLADLSGAIPRGDELVLLTQDAAGKEVVTHINLATGRSRAASADDPLNTAVIGAIASVAPDAGGGMSPAGADGAMDPDRVAATYQRLPLPGRLALPAVLSVNLNQERALREMREMDRDTPRPATTSRPDLAGHFMLIPTPDGFIQASVKLLESRLVRRSAMKSRPAKSALDGAVSVTQSADIANEIFNEMQRDRGGDLIEEDESRYLVTIRIPGAKATPEWKGEVIGPPEVHPLKTVNVIVAGKTLTVLDKQNQLKWRAALTYHLVEGPGAVTEENAPYGLGPCIERDDSLFVADEGVLTAFELASGEPRWRLPSVGISTMFFDDEGQLYLNTTTASPDRVRFSRQIDVTQRTSDVVIKLDSQTGRILWSEESVGLISHLSGKFIYTLRFHQPDELDLDDPYVPDTGFEARPFMRLKRINPKNGQVMWEHSQQRAPLDVQFQNNIIQLVFKKEVQVLKFLSF
jgi:hypothetical protein